MTNLRTKIEEVIRYFIDAEKKEEGEERKFAKRRGSEILSIISDYIDEEIISQAHKDGFSTDLKVDPRPSVGPIISGSVSSQSPISQEDLNKLTVKEIAEHLESE